jgi:hypothetical protein
VLSNREPLQDVSGGKPVLLEGVDLPLWGLEVDVEEGKREFASFNATNKTGDQVRCLCRLGDGITYQTLVGRKHSSCLGCDGYSGL